MKKIIWLLILILMPLSVLAYSEYIIPGGNTLGIEVNSKGIIVVGFYKVNGEYINQDLNVGDKIIKVHNTEVHSTDDLVSLINKYMENNQVEITYTRDNKNYIYNLELSLLNGSYRTGLYVKSDIIGIGTLTYIDPETNIYGALGHGLNLSKTNERIEIDTGYTYDAQVTSFTRSIDGNPGSKNANINKESLFGTIIKNTNYGIFGQTKTLTNQELLKIATLDEVSLGKAYIRTTNTNNEIKDYEIKILEINKSNLDKNIYFEVVDKELLKMSGGIVQGMSGSPIIQENKIVGAVTRVLVDDVKKGYGISIIKMLEEGEKNN